MKQSFIPETSTLNQEQKKIIDHASDINEAKELAPWACEVVEVDGGFMAFESSADFDIWKSQI